MNHDQAIVHNPKYGIRSGRELITVLTSAVVLSMLISVLFSVMAPVAALVASLALAAFAVPTAFWWQFRGRGKFPLKAPPKIRFVVGSSRR